VELYYFPPSSRALGVVALLNELELECVRQPVDLGRGDQRTDRYTALNPNQKIPTLKDGDAVIWESNAILFYLASKRPERGLWPRAMKDQADVMRWLFWQSAHWDAESLGMVAFERASKMVLGLGEADAAFVARGEANFLRFATVLDAHLRGRAWVAGEALTIADFSIGALAPTARNFALPIDRFPEIGRWYAALSARPSWRGALLAKDEAMAAWLAARAAHS